MRSTHAIDCAVRAEAKAMAELDGRSLGALTPEPARRGLGGAAVTHGAPAVRNGLLLLPTREGAAPVTLRLVKQLCADLP